MFIIIIIIIIVIIIINNSVAYSGYESHAPSNDFFPFRKLCFGGCQSNLSMAITASGVSRTVISVSVLGVGISELLFHLYLTR